MTSFSKQHPPGSIAEMIAVSLPMVVSFACDTVMIFTDRLFLAKLGPQSMSAAMAGGLSVWMLISFFLGLIGYTTAIVAQYLGAGQKGGCSRALTQSIILVLLAYPFILALKPAAHFFFAKSGIHSLQLTEQIKYFDIMIYGSVFMLGRHALSGFFTGIGRTRIVMMAAVAAMTMNMGLNYILVFGKFGCPTLGIQGAAIGTVIASLCGVMILLAVYLSRQNRHDFQVIDSFRWDGEVMSKLWRFGYPAGIEMFSNLAAFTGMVFVFHSEGMVAATSTTVVFNWDMVTFVPLLGIEIGVTSLVGRYMGARKIDVVDRVVVSGLKLGIAYGAMMTSLFILLPYQLVEVFRPQVPDVVFNEAVPQAVAMIKLVALYVIAQTFLIVFIGALRGAGDTVWAMRISVFIHWFILVVLVVMLKVIDTSVYAAWMALIIIFLSFIAAPYVRYRMGKWRSIRIVDNAFVP